MKEIYTYKYSQDIYVVYMSYKIMDVCKICKETERKDES